MCIAKFNYMPLLTERNNQLRRSAIHILLLRSKESPLLNTFLQSRAASGSSVFSVVIGMRDTTI